MPSVLLGCPLGDDLLMSKNGSRGLRSCGPQPFTKVRQHARTHLVERVLGIRRGWNGIEAQMRLEFSVDRQRCNDRSAESRRVGNPIIEAKGADRRSERHPRQLDVRKEFFNAPTRARESLAIRKPNSTNAHKALCRQTGLPLSAIRGRPVSGDLAGLGLESTTAAAYERFQEILKKAKRSSMISRCQLFSCDRSR